MFHPSKENVIEYEGSHLILVAQQLLRMGYDKHAIKALLKR
jgi:hypothetical protein